MSQLVGNNFINNNIYCKASAMVMTCIADWQNKNENKLPTVLEIGCAEGEGTMRFAGFCKKVYCIDPMVSGRPDVQLTEKDFICVDKEKVNLFVRRLQDYNVSLTIGLSADSNTISEFEKQLGNDKIHILLIDGCHHPYEAVMADFEIYYKYLADNAYIILDDLYEECIKKVYDDVIKKYNLKEHKRFFIYKENHLQDVASLEKVII